MIEKLSISEMRFETLTIINLIISAHDLEPTSDSSLKLQISTESQLDSQYDKKKKKFFFKH